MPNDKPVVAEISPDGSTEDATALNRAIDELQLLNSVAVALGAATDLDGVLGELVRRSLEAIGAEQGVIVLVEPGPGPQGHTLVRTRAAATTAEELRPGNLVLGWMQHHRKPLLLDSPASDAVFGDGHWPASVRNLVAVPMLAGGRLVGVLTLFNTTAPSGFTEDDARLLTILASQSAPVIERARLAEERARAELQRAEAEAERDRLLHALGLHTAPAIVDAVRQQGIAGLQARFGFTPQEARVALLLAERKTNQEVADELFVSPHTARRHTEQVLKKLGVVSRRAVAQALGIEVS